MKFTVVGANPVGWRTRTGLVLAGLALGAQAAVVDAPIDAPGLAAIEAPLPPGARVLDRALGGDVQAGPGNLGLLLELQRSEARVATGPGTQLRQPVASARAAASAVLVPMTPALLGDEIGGPRSELSTTRRDWHGHLATGSGGTSDFGRANGSASASANASGLVLDDLRRAVQYLRDHLHWLFGGLALLVLGAVVVKVVDRRI